MFIPKVFDGSSNTVAFKPSTLRLLSGFGYSNYGVPTHAIDALWISKAGSTRGALVTGVVNLSIRDEPVTEQFTYQEFLDNARVIKNPEIPRSLLRDVRFHAHALLDNRSAWTGWKNTVDNMLLLATVHKNLPNLPEDYDGWYSLTSRA